MTPLKYADFWRLSASLMRQMPQMARRPSWPKARWEAYQLSCLRARLGEAKTQVGLYRNRDLPDAQAITSLSAWSKLPILTKDDLLREPVAGHLNKAYQTDDLIISKSSGSSGKALDVYYDRESFYLFMLAGLRLYRMAFNYLPWHRQTYIYTSAYPLDSLFGLYPLQFISTLEPIAVTIAKLRKSPPDLLVCYPSHLRAIVAEMKPSDFERIRPRAINVNSEMSSASERDYLSKKLGCFVFDDYSSEELTRIASQCRHATYHVFEDINYMEVVDDSGKPVREGVIGQLVGTNLHNRGMPLLRYAQGDRAAIRTGTCACGSTFRHLESLEGRRNDSFILPSGAELSSGYLLDLTYGIFLDYEQAVRAFCLIQESPTEWRLELQTGPQWHRDLAQQIHAELSNRVAIPEIDLQVKLVEQVTRTASGKSNPIVSRVAR